jgi:hypothetical protein
VIVIGPLWSACTHGISERAASVVASRSSSPGRRVDSAACGSWTAIRSTTSSYLGSQRGSQQEKQNRSEI